MKKLLAILLVLGMASMAQASFILSVGGVEAPDTMDMEPSQWIELDIHKAAEGLFLMGDLAIEVSGPGHLAWGGSDAEAPNPDPLGFAATVPTQYGTGGPAGVTYTTYDMAWELPFATSPLSTDKYLKIFGGNSTWNTEAPYTLMDNLWFHCDGPGEVVIDLVAAGDLVYATHVAAAAPPFAVTIGELVVVAPEGTSLDKITIQQIPEPMTMSLLGLGGLALLRRRA